MTATPPIVDRDTWQKPDRHAARQGEGARPRGDAIAEARWRLPMVEVDPTSAVVGAAGEVPLIDTFQEPVAAVCVGVRRRVRLRDDLQVCDLYSFVAFFVDDTIRSRLSRWARPWDWLSCSDTADEFEIRPILRVPGLLFVPVPEEKAGKNRLHPDFRPVDQTAEVERLLSLGARRADVGQRDASWVVLADPEGNEFCILSGWVRPDY